MKSFYFLALIFFSTRCFAQSPAIDSCKILPLYTASFAGVEKKGMINFDDRYKLKQIVSEDKDAVIIRFTVTIDCDDCDIYTREVYGDTLSAQDMKAMSRTDARYIISFDCITGKTKKGELVSYKPFLFYIKP